MTVSTRVHFTVRSFGAIILASFVVAAAYLAYSLWSLYTLPSGVGAMSLGVNIAFVTGMSWCAWAFGVLPFLLIRRTNGLLNTRVDAAVAGVVLGSLAWLILFLASTTMRDSGWLGWLWISVVISIALSVGPRRMEA